MPPVSAHSAEALAELPGRAAAPNRSISAGVCKRMQEGTVSAPCIWHGRRRTSASRLPAACAPGGAKTGHCHYNSAPPPLIHELRCCGGSVVGHDRSREAPHAR